MRIAPVNLKILAYTLEVEGFEAARVLQQCGIDPDTDMQEDGPWVPVALFDRMMAAALEVTSDPAFGLVAGKSLALMKYSVITPVALSTPTLRQLLDDLQRFAVLVVERSELSLLEDGSDAFLMIEPVVRKGLSGNFRTEQVATSAVQMLRFAGASNSDIYQVSFPYPEPEGQAQRYVASFGPRIAFGQPTCSVRFNAALLDAPLPTHDPIANMAARTRAETLLAGLKAGSDIADRVRQWLLSALPNVPTVKQTAEHLGMSERTLRRHLYMLDLTYAALAQECQRMLAEQMLAEGKLPLKQIAEALGFSSVHSFHRAFRRWYGATPSDWRDKRVAGEPTHAECVTAGS